MADSGERNMLFDIRGRRKRVIQVVYAALALLMALSLFTVVGPVSLDGLLGTGGGSTDAGSIYDDQIERLEKKLNKNPDDQAALVQLTRAYALAGSSQKDPSTGAPTEDAIEDFDAAGDAWIRYIKTKPEKPSATVAQLAATALISSATIADLDTRVKAAASAQAIYAEANPSTNAYLQLAQLRYFAGDTAGAEQAGNQAKGEADAAQRPQVKQILIQYEKAGEQIQKQAKKATSFQPGAGGEQALQNPLGGLSGGGSGTAAP
jgi:hypothetical protein